MRRTMHGVAPAANPPSLSPASPFDSASGYEHADTAVALPPDMMKALAELTMQSASAPSLSPTYVLVPAAGLASSSCESPESAPAPMTMRMSEAPPARRTDASPPADRRSSPSIAPTAPRSAPSVAPPRSAPSVGPAGSGSRPRQASVAPFHTPSTDPLAHPIGARPLEKTPFATTVAVDPSEAQAVFAASHDDERTMINAPLVSAANGSPVAFDGLATRVSASPGPPGPPAPPAYRSVPTAAGTIKGPPLGSQAHASPRPFPQASAMMTGPRVSSPPMPMPPSMFASPPSHGGETMALARPTGVPIAPTASMHPARPPVQQTPVQHTPVQHAPVKHVSNAAMPKTVVSAVHPANSSARPMPMPSTPKAFGPGTSVPPTSPSPANGALPNGAAPKGSVPNAWAAPVVVPKSPASQDSPASGPLTYQVFTGAVPARPTSPSRVSYPEPVATKASLGLRVCLALLGLCVVVGTAGAIAINASDDGPRGGAAKPGLSVGVGGAGAATAPPATAPPAPPVPVSAALPPQPAAPPAQPVASGPASLAPPGSVKPAGSAKPKPASSAPPGLKGVAVPPNPFGGGAKPLPEKRK